jgi:DNA-binding XRE family transcriptional regulator
VVISRVVGRCPVVVEATLPTRSLCVKHKNMLAAFYFHPYGQHMSKTMTHAMRAAGINDTKLAALIGCSQSHINRIRNGKMVPRRVMANAIERALSVHGLADELTKKERDRA